MQQAAAFASLIAMAAHSIFASLSVDVRIRLGALLGLSGVSIGVSVSGSSVPPQGFDAVVLAMVIIVASSLAWRIPARLRTWAMDVAEGLLVLLALSLLFAGSDTRATGIGVVHALAVAWALLGVGGGVRGRGFDPRPTTSILLGLGVVVPVVLDHTLSIPGPASGPVLPAVVAVGLVSISVAMDTKLDLFDGATLVLRAIAGAAAIIVAMWITELPLDQRALLPALVGGVAFARPRSSSSLPESGDERHRQSTSSDVAHIERETLVILERLADPHASDVDALNKPFLNTFPGARMTLLRTTEEADTGPTLDQHLLGALCRYGVLRANASDELSTPIRSALRRLGRDVLLLPVAYEDTIYGALMVRGLSPSASTMTELRRFADLLGHRLEAQRLYSALQHKQRLADLGTFAAALAHDLRSPLAAARLEAQLMQRSAGSNAGGLSNIINALDRVIQDLQGTLDFTRALDLNLDPVDLTGLLEEVVASHDRQSSAQGVELRLEYEAGRTEVRGDRARLLRVFENLTRNALEVAPAGSAVLLRVLEDDEDLRIEVCDRGPGIDPEVEGRLFEPFVTTKSEGVGLGLAICRKVIDAHRGRIEPRSQPDGGTCMQVWLPASTATTS